MNRISSTDRLAINAIEAVLQNAGVAAPGLAERAWRAGLSARTTGTQNGRAKLMPHQVNTIRTMREAGESYSAIARAFGVSRRTIVRVVTRENWK